MKTIFSMLFVASMTASFAHAGCEKCKEGDKKKETATLVDCDKCKEGDKKKETALVDCDKCKKGDKEKEQGTAVA